MIWELYPTALSDRRWSLDISHKSHMTWVAPVVHCHWPMVNPFSAPTCLWVNVHWRQEQAHPVENRRGLAHFYLQCLCKEKAGIPPASESDVTLRNRSHHCHLQSLYALSNQHAIRRVTPLPISQELLSLTHLRMPLLDSDDTAFKCNGKYSTGSKVSISKQFVN